MTEAQELWEEATKRLEPIFGRDTQSDIRRIFDAILGQGFDPKHILLDDEITDLQAAIAARSCHQPVAQIIGKRAFWDHEFIVTPDVLDPRPDSETLIEAALKGPEPSRILDIGTGSGCLLLSLIAHWSNAQGLGVDCSPAALNVAKRNAGMLELENRITFQQSNWADQVTGQYDLVISNPPYIQSDIWQGLSRDVREWEPKMALTSGPTGLEAYEAILSDLDRILAPSGRVLFEIGFDQGETVSELVRRFGFGNPSVIPDINGKARVVSFEKTSE